MISLVGQQEEVVNCTDSFYASNNVYETWTHVYYHDYNNYRKTFFCPRSTKYKD